MRHRQHTGRLNLTASPRKALLRNLVLGLLRHEKIRTTEARAAQARRHAEKMITLAREASQVSRRAAFAFLQHKTLVTKLFDEIGPRFKDRPGGYLRIVKDSPRQGDGAAMAILEMVDREITLVTPEESDKKKTRGKRLRELRRSMARNAPKY